MNVSLSSEKKNVESFFGNLQSVCIYMMKESSIKTSRLAILVRLSNPSITLPLSISLNVWSLEKERVVDDFDDRDGRYRDDES